MDAKITALNNNTAIADADLIAIVDDVAGTPVTEKRTVGQLKAHMYTGGTLTGPVQPADHGTATNPEIVAVVYGTGSPPTANTTPIGTLWVKYTA
jgi:orotate phosphoribosyltransferase-like protein